MRALGFDDTRIERVDADLLWAKLAGKNTGYGIDRAFGANINRRVGGSEAGDTGANIDDASVLTLTLGSQISRH